jgi:lipid-binding SYLF domain-containing protein
MKSVSGRTKLRVVALIAAPFVLLIFWSGSLLGATAQEIDASVDAAIKQLDQEVPGGQEVIDRAAGVLIFPRVTKAGLGVGGEYGEGALRVRGRTEGYYSIGAASFGFQAGAQRRSVLIAFMEPSALERFREGSGFKVGGDMSVAVLKMGASGGIDTSTVNQPVVAIIFGEKGLMYNLTLEGSKITKLKK